MADARQQQLFVPEPDPLPFEIAEREARLVARVVVNRPLDEAYSYLVPEGMRETLRPGMRVRVPFGKGDRLVTGYCVGIDAAPATHRPLKEIAELLDREPLLTAEMLDLTKWMAERYLAGWGQVIESVVPAGVKSLAGTREIVCYEPIRGLRDRMDDLKLPKKQRAVVEALVAAKRPLSAPEIAEAAKCGTAPINALRKKRLIVPLRTRTEVDELTAATEARQPDFILNEEQQHALDRILETVRAGEHRTFLLHGVTGSGKTEVYIRAIREIVSYGRQAIVLVPEISLTPQTIRRFRQRFPSVAVLHSHLSDAERHRQWSRIAAGEVQVVIGARSAVFAPTPHLGIIVIDEEHETTFKQQTTPRYHAREVARERTRRLNVPLILGSATPMLESLQRAREKQDQFLTLSQRVERRPLPAVTLVDMRNDPFASRGHAIGRAMRQAIQTALDDNGQVILFLNLRGYHPVLWCGNCKGAVKCPDCDISLTWHRDVARLLCHSCGFALAAPTECPVCGLPGLRYLGTGTQRLEQEVIAKFPDATVLRMDSDSMRRPGSHDRALESFRRGEVQILLGTQMIAKGLDFPQVTLVGVIDADTILHQPDLRAGERTFQLIAQVAGRTGRGDRPGRVIVQTMNPDEPVIRFAAKHDYFSFAKAELAHRQQLQQPPFAHLARIVLRGPEEEVVGIEIRKLANELRPAAEALDPPVKVLGPAPAPILKLRGQYRFHMLLSAERPETLAALWTSQRRGEDLPKEVEMTIDVDPIDMR